MEVIRGEMTEAPPDRLSIRHLEGRDETLGYLRQAQEAMRALAEVERGSSHGKQSPRHQQIRVLLSDLDRLTNALDQVYV